MKPICGIIVAEGKGNQGRVAKVCITPLYRSLSFLDFTFQYHFHMLLTRFSFLNGRGTVFLFLHLLQFIWVSNI